MSAERPIERVLPAFKGVKRRGKGWMALCPAHDDSTASLSIDEAKDGSVLVKCHAGCDFPTIAACAGLEAGAFFPRTVGLPKKGSADIVYLYRDAKGQLVYKVVRRAAKRFSQCRPDGNGGWIWNLDGVERVPYRLPELLASGPEVWVWVVEGEKDVDQLRDGGLIATCNSGGAGKWQTSYASSLKGRRVAIIPDNDDPGRLHARAVAASLEGIAKYTLIELPGLPEHGDVSDWLVDHTIEQLTALVEPAERDAPPVARGNGETRQLAVDVTENKPAEGGPARAPDDGPADSWPSPLADAAFYGLAGDAVRVIEPTTEADPAALLFQFLVFFGNCVGRGPHFFVEATRHGLNEFLVLVGATSKGRKGTSEARIRNLFERADTGWATERIKSGLSSGEGLIYHVRDAVWEPDKKTGEPVMVDPGVEDKRLLAMESEFASVLRRQQGETSSLSPVMREAWDGKVLDTLVKNSKNRAQDSHVSTVGHITKAEVNRYLTTTEAANGFANRFLFVGVRRTRLLPLGGVPPNTNEIVRRLREALDFARQLSLPIDLDGEATATWVTVYGPLSDGKPGLLGNVIGRAEAHVRRLAATVAVLDLSPTVRREHLLAALAAWDYCEASARFVFGDALGDSDADLIMDALLDVGAGGLTRGDLLDHFQRHWSSERITRSLNSLMSAAMIRSQSEKTVGRPATRYYATRRSMGEGRSYLEMARKASGGELSELSEVSGAGTGNGEDSPSDGCEVSTAASMEAALTSHLPRTYLAASKRQSEPDLGLTSLNSLNSLPPKDSHSHPATCPSCGQVTFGHLPGTLIRCDCGHSFVREVGR